MTDDFFDKLAEPFAPDAVSWRIGSVNQEKTKGLALAYLDARDVMDRLDLVCGPAGWQNRYSHVGGVTVCEISIKVDDAWITKADGAGASDIEAEKGMLSDSFKRAAVRWGIGRYLYSLPSPWVTLSGAGKGIRIAEPEYTKLRQLLAHHMGTTLTALKNAAQAKRDGDFDFYLEKLASAEDMEALGAIGREIKQALPMMPASQREPLQDAYLNRREELKEKERELA